MPTNVYAALCLGGPMAGQYLEWNSPTYEIVIQTPLVVVPQRRRNASYYFVPLVGLRGFWLFEDETKGSQPWDDIIRVLCDDYIKHNSRKVQ